MKKETILTLIILIASNCYSQKEANIWYFGKHAGLDFNAGSPAPLIDGAMSTNEGCSSISDSDGNILFYTDGLNIWNKDHVVMLNGFNLNGDSSSTNSAIILPKPNDEDNYFVFTVDKQGGANGIQYSEIDMALDGGLGGVNNTKNVNLTTPVTEKVTVIKHSNNFDYWVVSHKWNSDEFIAFLVTSSGVTETPIVSKVGDYITDSRRGMSALGAIKISPNGSKIAVANSFTLSDAQLFDFDNSTGIVSNPITLNNLDVGSGPYGIEFSPNSKILYVGVPGLAVYQYDVFAGNEIAINNSKISITNPLFSKSFFALQLGPDGKIYIAKSGKLFLDVIEKPNILGLGCTYLHEEVALGDKKSTFGLPSYNQSLFEFIISHKKNCFGDQIEFNIHSEVDTIAWNFGDLASGINNTSSEITPTHVYSHSGVFKVTATINEETVIVHDVTINDTPIVNTPINIIHCNDDSSGFSVFNLNNSKGDIIQNPEGITISFFETQLDAGSNTNAIVNTENYPNQIANRDVVWARIENVNNCYSISQIYLIVEERPKFELIEEDVICLNINSSIEITTFNPNGLFTYQWTNENGIVISNNLFATVFESGIYTVIATSNFGCESYPKQITIRRSEIATITLDQIEIIDDSNNNSINISLNNLEIGDYEFVLDNEYGEYQSIPFFENVEPGIHAVYIRDRNGCGISQIEVSVIKFPNFFTPNNDGFNDTWNVIGINSAFYSNSIIQIYSRFGKILANVHPASIGWDGLYNGREMPSTDYWFLVELVDDNGLVKIMKGHFSLVR